MGKIISEAGQVLATVRRIRSTAAREVVFPDGTAVLFSYATPVAFYVETGGLTYGAGYYRTGSVYSRTTTKHVNSWPRARGDAFRGYIDVVSYTDIAQLLAERLPGWRSLEFCTDCRTRPQFLPGYLRGIGPLIQ